MKTMVISIVFCLTASALSGQIAWTTHTLNQNFNGASSVYTADIDRDGRIDVIGSALVGNRIAWWHNEGGIPVTWTEFLVDSAFVGASFVHCADIDGDSLTDIIGCAWNGHEVAWWRNGGGCPPQWTKQTLDASFNNAHEVNAADIDNDGDLDIIAASAGNNEIAWWRNEGGTPIQWSKTVIDNAFAGARSVRTADFDADGDIDLVGAALLANTIKVWYNNYYGDSAWTVQVVDNALAYAHMTSPADIDGDGDVDIAGEGYGASTIYWWQNNGGYPVQWMKHSLGGYSPSCLSVCTADVDGDGHVDILSTSDTQGNIAWWRNSGDSSITWTKQIVTAVFDGAWPVRAVDIDSDGDTDVLGGAYYADDIAWFENTPAGIDEMVVLPAQDRRSGGTLISEIVMPRGSGVCRLLDISGRSVKANEAGPGVYFIVIDGSISRKIVKAR